MSAAGLYIHVPFCARKCPYCDFYSLAANGAMKNEYLERVVQLLSQRDDFVVADTVYIGGGTPSQLGTERLIKLLNAIKEHCEIRPGAEITLECNPSDIPAVDAAALRLAGYNRVSLGLQSAVDAERKALGRRGKAQDVQKALLRLRRAGFDNISLDIMLGVPGQTIQSLERTLAFIAAAEVRHVSAYVLKIEPDTPFDKRRAELDLPDEDAQADMYLFACEQLVGQGFGQYEISNFARPGFESHHNLKYWRCKEYLGLGPGAHSFLDGRRFYWPRDLEGFIAGNEPVQDGTGGDFEEYAMLALRLNEGLREVSVHSCFGHGIPADMRRRAGELKRHVLAIVDADGIRLTREGFLVSNSVIAEIIN